MKTRLFEGKQDDLRMGANAHGRPPCTASAGCVNLKLAMPLESIGVAAKGAVCHPTEGKYLAPVGVPAQLEAHARFFNDGEPVWHVLEQDRCGSIEVKILQEGLQVDWTGGLAIGNADYCKAVDMDHFFIKNMKASALQRLCTSQSASELVVVAHYAIGAERGIESEKRLRERPRIGFSAIENIARQKDDGGVQLTCDGCDATGKPLPVNVAQVKIAHDQCCAAFPMGREMR